MAAKKKDTTTIDASAYDYGSVRLRDKEGKLHKVKGNGDAVFRAMALHTVVNGKTLESVAKANKLELKQYVNVGQLRMAIGSMLRGLVKNGTPVDIGGVTVKSLEQKVALPEEKEGAKPAAKKAAKPAKKAKKAAKPRKAKASEGEGAAAE
jgi:hypothetical protein